MNWKRGVVGTTYAPNTECMFLSFPLDLLSSCLPTSTWSFACVQCVFNVYVSFG